jgi:phosphate uptake regulator
MDTQKHISSAFDQDLRILNDALQQLGDLAYQQLEGAMEGLAMQNQANLDKVIKGDAALDALEGRNQ